MKLLYPTIEPHLSNTSPKLEVSFLILARRPSHQSNTFLNTKRNKEINEMLNTLQVGSEVIAASGILGKVKNIKGEYVSIEVSDSVEFKLQKSAIANILPKGTIDSIK